MMSFVFPFVGSTMLTLSSLSELSSLAVDWLVLHPFSLFPEPIDSLHGGGEGNRLSYNVMFIGIALESTFELFNSYP